MQKLDGGPAPIIQCETSYVKCKFLSVDQLWALEGQKYSLALFSLLSYNTYIKTQKGFYKMSTLELGEVFGKYFWDLATMEQAAEMRDHHNEVALYTEYREAQEEIETCESLDYPV